MFYKYDDNIYAFFYKHEELKTIQDYEELHRIYWGLIANKKLIQKPIIRDYNTNAVVQCNCFACAYVRNLIHTLGLYGSSSCKYCPIEQYRKAVPLDGRCPCCERGLFLEWTYYGDSELAKQISELKFTEPNT